MARMREKIHGGDIRSSLERYPDMEFLDFSANINPLGMPESVKEALAGSAGASLHYPDPFCRELKAALAGFEKVPPEQILPGNGASDIIYRIAYGLRPRSALIPAPTFAEYEEALGLVDCSVQLHPLSPQNGFSVDEGILDHIPGKDVVFLCNPNNPCGNLVETGLMERIYAACEAEGALLVVDECFLDFVEAGERHSLKPLLARGGKLLILRAFTKIFAMPGIRLGYALCGDGQLLHALDRAGATWSVSVPAQRCGVAGCGEGAFVRRTVEEVSKQRNTLTERLRGLGLRVYPSAANYILFYTEDTGLAEKLLRLGVMMRDCSNYHNLSPGHFRVAVRSGADNERLVQALKEALACRESC